MAAIVDIIATVLGDTSENVWCGSAHVKNWLASLCLAVGKAADIAVDWVIVVQLLGGAFSQRTDSKECLIAAVACAVLGSAIEVFATYQKVRLHREVKVVPRRLLENVRLNRRLAWPRFLCDDLPATVLGIYLITTDAAGGDSALASLVNGSSIVNVTECVVTTRTTRIFTASAAGSVERVVQTSECSVQASADEGRIAIVLVVLSCSYSLMAMFYHQLTASMADELKPDETLDESAREWDLTTGDAVRTLTGHGDRVYAVCALGGERLASGSKDKTVRMWDLTTGEAMRTLTGHGGGVSSVCALGGERLASGSGDNTVRVWDLTTGEAVRTLIGHNKGVSSVCALGGELLASASGDRTVRVWDLKTGESVRILTGHDGAVWSVCALGVLGRGKVVGQRLASASADKSIRVWDLLTGEAISTLTGHERGVFSVCALGGERLASGSGDFTVRIWNLTTGEAVRTLTGHGRGVSSVCALGGERLASGSGDKTVRVWDLTTGEAVRTLTGHDATVWSMCALGSERLASGSVDSTVRVWDATVLKSAQKRRGPNNTVCVSDLTGLKSHTRTRSLTRVRAAELAAPPAGPPLSGTLPPPAMMAGATLDA